VAQNAAALLPMKGAARSLRSMTSGIRFAFRDECRELSPSFDGRRDPASRSVGAARAMGAHGADERRPSPGGRGSSQALCRYLRPAVSAGDVVDLVPP
jgi:hypothetical protein